VKVVIIVGGNLCLWDERPSHVLNGGMFAACFFSQSFANMFPTANIRRQSFQLRSAGCTLIQMCGELLFLQFRQSIVKRSLEKFGIAVSDGRHK
jgi:hypothetical protein